MKVNENIDLWEVKRRLFYGSFLFYFHKPDSIVISNWVVTERWKGYNHTIKNWNFPDT